MAANSKFAVAVHALAVLGVSGDTFVTSDTIASSVNTNPVVIRRLMGALIKAKLVESLPGKTGGARLARKPEKVTLLDIYRSVETDGIFALHSKPEEKSCPISCKMKAVLKPMFRQAENAVEDALKQQTLADILNAIAK